MRVHVEALRGGYGDERPARFHVGNTTIRVIDILDRWYGEDAVLFRVRGDDEHMYVLKHSYASGDAGSWEMVSFTHKDSRGTDTHPAEDTQVRH